MRRMFEDIWEFSKETSKRLTDPRKLRKIKKCTAGIIAD